MGTVTERKRKDGTLGFTAQIRIKRDGKIVHTEARTFDRKVTASAWLVKRESELSAPDATLGRKKDTKTYTLSEAIEKYVEAKPEMGRTKTQVLRSLLAYDIAAMDCHEITSTDLTSLASELSKGRKPQTVGNYMSHLQSVFAVAQDAWGMPLDEAQMVKALRAVRRLGTVTKSASRDRRPTIEELDKLMTHFQEVWNRNRSIIPMHRVMAFALFSARRQDEITRLLRSDYEGDRVLVRDMKHPGQKIGNNVWCDLPAPVPGIIDAMPKDPKRLFPYHSDSISASFTRACKFLGIEDLHFHDLRHEGASRLSEMGWTIQQVAQVTGHQSWASLKRYTHMRQSGDKYANWKWIEVVTGE